MLTYTAIAAGVRVCGLGGVFSGCFAFGFVLRLVRFLRFLRFFRFDLVKTTERARDSSCDNDASNDVLFDMRGSL